MSEESAEIERLEKEHIDFDGRKASECPCCEGVINSLKKELNKNQGDENDK